MTAPAARDVYQADIALWPRNRDATTASFRLRHHAVLNALKADGLKVRRYTAGSPAPDILVLQKINDQATFDEALRLRQTAGTRVCLDLCDSITFAKPENLAKSIAFWQLYLSRLDAIITASTALGDILRASFVDLPPIYPIDDLIDEPVLPSHPNLRGVMARLHGAMLRARMRLSGIPLERRLVWFGRSTGKTEDVGKGGIWDLGQIRDALAEHNKAAPLSLTVISNNRDVYRRVLKSAPFQSYYLRWSAETFYDLLGRHGVALLPINLSDFTICKSSNRVVTATQYGLAVAATSIPSYEVFRGSIVLDDWGAGLGELLCNPQARQQSIARARAVVERSNTPPVIARAWAEALGSTLAAPPRPLD